MADLRVSVLLLVAGLTGLTLGCASRFDKMVRARAADDFGCAQADIQITERSANALGGSYDVTGCDKSDRYQTRCSLLGICSTSSSGQIAAQEQEYERQRLAREQYRAEHPQSQSAPSSGGSQPASSSSSRPPASSSSSRPAASSLPKNCSFASDCGAGIKCNSGRCANTEGSSCNFDGDCGGNGAKCNSSKCSNAPDGKCNFDSQCAGGKCNSGKCKF